MPSFSGSRRRRPGDRVSKPAARPVLRRLRRAHRLLAAGDAAAAARILEGLARGAQTRRRPRAGRLLLQAGYAQLAAGNHDRAVGLIQEGLSEIAEHEESGRLAAAARRALRALEAHGMGERAGKLRGELLVIDPTLDLSSGAAMVIPPAPGLPPTCPRCGGPVHPDEVQRAQSGAALCAYCGLSLEPPG